MRRKERYREGGRENKLFKRESFKSPHHYTKLIISSYLWSVRLRSPGTINPDYAEQKNLSGRRLNGCNRAVIFKNKKYFDSKTPFKKKKSRHILIKCIRHRWSGWSGVGDMEPHLLVPETSAWDIRIPVNTIQNLCALLRESQRSSTSRNLLLLDSNLQTHLLLLPFFLQLAVSQETSQSQAWMSCTLEGMYGDIRTAEAGIRGGRC